MKKIERKKRCHMRFLYSFQDGKIIPESPECFLPDLPPEIYFLKALPVKVKFQFLSSTLCELWAIKKRFYNRETNSAIFCSIQ